MGEWRKVDLVGQRRTGHGRGGSGSARHSRRKRLNRRSEILDSRWLLNPVEWWHILVRMRERIMRAIGECWDRRHGSSKAHPWVRLLTLHTGLSRSAIDS